MDVRNLGTTALTVRLLLEDPMGGPPVDEAVTSFGAVLPAGSEWTHVAFPVSAASLTALSGSTSTLLGQVTLLRIIHSPTTDDAVPVIGVLGVDNITAAAAAIPEPASVLLAVPALLAFRAGRRRSGTLRHHGLAYADPGASYYEERYGNACYPNLQRRAKSLGFVLQEANRTPASPGVS